MTPDLTAVLLAVFSAFTLALNNLLVKKSGDVLMGRVSMSLSSGLIMLPTVFFVPLPTPELAVAIFVSFLVHVAYQTCLIRTLHRGDLSLVFPVMRGSAPLMVGIGSYFVLNEQLSAVSWSGLIIAALAVASFGFLHGSKSTDSKSVSREALLWACLTAIGVTSYSIVDARGVRVADEPLTFVFWLFVIDWMGVTTGALIARRGSFIADIRPVALYGFASGALAIMSYGAALYAFTLVEAARVTAIRETAVVIGALMGWLILKEGMGPRRIIASIVLVMGLAIMELGA